MTGPAFDFCFLPNAPLAEIVDLARLGESLGYRTMWIPDQDFLHDPFVLAAAVAGGTDRIGVGIGITTPLTRHSAHIARVAASLDELSGHRLTLGLGSGNIDHVVRPMGFPAAGPLGRVRDGIAAVTALLRGEPVRFADDAPEVRLGVEVTRQIPLYLGARGPKMLELAGRTADGVLVESLFNGAGMAHAVDCVRSGVEGSGRDTTVDVVSWQVVVVSDDPRSELDRFRSWVARMMQVGPPEAMLRIGVAEENLERVVGLMAAGRAAEAAAAVSDESVQCVVLVDTPARLVERIAAVLDRGARSVSLVSSASAELTAHNLTRFAKEVAPAFTTAD
ncbi:LLM class flavin-dependent oxidoreductase [Pseudonocardia sp. H11422]|uniref:LLM class flavin-dependent oxidoreductase n=1 Tax=Pseudonocardia sp. H11422 TaxID=2835866 RepID=UPI001BDC1E83|nr:LLM class flavin-dependent oxidoreductase [Pseudonocardia sp. H11422]